jgi:penicillin-binding protein 1B
MTSANGSARGAGGPPVWRRHPWWFGAAGAVLLLGIAVGFFVLRPFWRLSSRFEQITFRQPSRLYAQPTQLEEGHAVPVERLVKDLVGEGYREEPGAAVLPPGRYRTAPDSLSVHLRSFFLPDGRQGGGLLEVAWHGARVSAMTLNGQPVAKAELEPPLLASYYGPDQLERRPVTVDEVAENLINAVIAAEDDSFFSHSGVAPSSILRALWVNVRGGQLRQGGSTLTQQVVKNIYLSQERKLTRKIQEAVLAVMLEMRYSKREILTAYLNEIYLGRSGGVNVMGMGAASRAYFGKDASQLNLAEAATLAGIIPAPAAYSPLFHPDRARERRDWVLHRMQALGLADQEHVAAALATPVAVAPEPLVRRRAPYFADAVTAEAAKRFDVDDLEDGGYSLYSTLSWDDEQAAQAAIDAGLATAEKGYEKGKTSALQVALISIQPATGEILAYIGGRRYDQSQFDRVSQANRQTGSAFKPIVYAAAFEEHRATPATFLEDEPLEIESGGRTWSPKNDDGEFHGWVTVRTALEHSYNPATARLAMEVGIPRIVSLAHALGITTRMEPFPAVALGSTAVAPIELATVYASLAAGGIRPPVHGLEAVVDSHGKRIEGKPLPVRVRVLTPQADYLVTSLMIGVLERGTGAGSDWHLHGKLAGKTGTTNDRRDSWFGGFAPERSTVVWVGYDDNAVTRLSGARAALPIWSRFTVAVTPPGGYSTFPQPSGIDSALIDPESGLLATESCPETLTEVFWNGEVPSEQCSLHPDLAADAAIGPQPPGTPGGPGGPGGQRPEGEPGAAPGQSTNGRADDKQPVSHPFRRWLHRIFGGHDDEQDNKSDGKPKDDPNAHPATPPPHPRSSASDRDDRGGDQDTPPPPRGNQPHLPD